MKKTGTAYRLEYFKRYCMMLEFRVLKGFKNNDVSKSGIGVFRIDRTDGTISSVDGYEEPMEERNAHAPPPSLVPRLHAIIHHKLRHNNPHLPAEKEKVESGKTYYKVVSSIIFLFKLNSMELW